MKSQKFVLAPCMGVGKIVANVTRRAAYLVHQKFPETTALLSLPALLAGDAEQRELIEHNPVILIDGCGERCGIHIFNELGVFPIGKIEVGHIMAETKLGPGKTRQQLEDIGRRLSEAVAARIEVIMDDKHLTESFRPAEVVKTTEAACGPDCSCFSPPTDAPAASGKPPKYVTIFPCQGIRRTGGRVTQRAAYMLVEDKFPGKTLLLCVPALTAAVQEDVDMLEQFPTVAINGCDMRCATMVAARHGVPPEISVDMNIVSPAFKGERECTLPDITAEESQAAVLLAEACSVKISDLLAGKYPWKPAKANMLGMVNQPGKINDVAGYKKCDRGYMIRPPKPE
ncbi:MAG TPA: putative zinc-binding protein [Planctomycetota bacterium]|jgi:uncharacterized metal-binding protein